MNFDIKKAAAGGEEVPSGGSPKEETLMSVKYIVSNLICHRTNNTIEFRSRLGQMSYQLGDFIRARHSFLKNYLFQKLILLHWYKRIHTYFDLYSR
jgi:hypothetical protein